MERDKLETIVAFTIGMVLGVAGTATYWQLEKWVNESQEGVVA